MCYCCFTVTGSYKYSIDSHLLIYVGSELVDCLMQRMTDWVTVNDWHTKWSKQSITKTSYWHSIEVFISKKTVLSLSKEKPQFTVRILKKHFPIQEYSFYCCLFIIPCTFPPHHTKERLYFSNTVASCQNNLAASCSQSFIVFTSLKNIRIYK